MTRTILLITRVFLLLACTFWLLLLLELVGPAFTHGLAGVQGKLMHMWMIGRLTETWTCSDSLRVIHQGYTSLIGLLLLTWAAVELKRWLIRVVGANSQSTPAVPNSSR